MVFIKNEWVLPHSKYPLWRKRVGQALINIVPLHEICKNKYINYDHIAAAGKEPLSRRFSFGLQYLWNRRLQGKLADLNGLFIPDRY